jgi:hypothetical protein
MKTTVAVLLIFASVFAFAAPYSFEIPAHKWRRVPFGTPLPADARLHIVAKFPVAFFLLPDDHLPATPEELLAIPCKGAGITEITTHCANYRPVSVLLIDGRNVRQDAISALAERLLRQDGTAAARLLEANPVTLEVR